ncbi:MAG: GerMN domain-containing protein [Psychrilyobacter sp.]|uniref:GerMN domain-containing protein n=1 Tax=Psychrilyobacter sp. TaxID=2586924 RepID=UPI003C7247AF
MKDKKRLFILGTSITLLLVSSIFFYKYVTLGDQIPIKKITTHKNIKTLIDIKVVKIYTPNDSLDSLVSSDIEITKESFAEEIKTIFNTIHEQSNYQIKDENGNYYPFMDPNIHLLNSYLVGDKLYLNLTPNITNNIKTKEQELLIIYSLVNTYTSLEGINRVKILIDNVEVKKLKWYNLRNFYTQNLDI